jgi:cyclophilin family peptidyl-prolyl cis-trans isomerase
MKPTRLKIFTNKRLPILVCMLAVVLTASGCGQKYSNNSGQNAAATPKPTAVQSASPSSSPKSWPTAPAMQIDPKKHYTADVKTSKGSFTIDLIADKAPKTVNNFVFLAKAKFFEGITFHRIIQTFMIQTGDPLGTGAGGPGYKFADELPPAAPYSPGIVAMANAGPNTNGSQFFICTGPDSAGLNQIPNYTVFGKISAGMDTVQAIAATPVQKNPNTGETSMPTEKVIIESVTITEK